MAAAPGLTRNLRRLTDPPRIPGVDLARGLAVFGMLAAHLLWIDAFDWAQPETWNDITRGRSSILFATLAGVSIGLFTGGATPLQDRALSLARRRLVARGLLLWLLGVVLLATGVPVYVVLPTYAVLFLIAIPLTSLSARTLLVVAGALALITPFAQAPLDALPLWQTTPGVALSAVLGWHYPFVTWSAFVVAGLGIARAGLDRLLVQVWLLWAGAVLAFVGYTWDAVAGAPEDASGWAAVWTADAHSSGLLEVIGSGGFALAVIGACLLLCRTPVRAIVLPVRAVGSMPLTAYVGQLVGWAIAAGLILGAPEDLAGFRDLQPFWVFVVVTLLGCTAWALWVGRGPLEWLTDRMTRAAVAREDAAADRDAVRPDRLIE
ncbi:heparan-alpha-glucosaminide N-acetyltransferase domain-containing protein [Microbacterium terricola]|uniref:Heparan-alpha-glucosaminide N-acetyltransferase catalytic domain-containing protein n=1 Tax=Microbacterium terricola TaxID=344163 RepID=A0ABM8DXR4_9MICO|nr:heparan-alpha-glucosaminide N-acetyltransferase domain-containing protein [Microbacterium terricola]UYK38998.1 heparan-alpha-glucosaminide N-acetyltransferase domain-containing protein [Microbacterium terricola]BDV30296.1 hypothetical protein Microterr_09560 [Microbacterium terricola]